MKTPEQWMEKIGCDEGVCCGHGEYWDLPKRVTIEMVQAIQKDAEKSPRHVLAPHGERWWCVVHRRLATHLFLRPYNAEGDLAAEHCCAPGKGGIMLPCKCVSLGGPRCPMCGEYVPGHATDGQEICTCHS